ncbi:MAG TPA: patatin-like phospholipase family protein [Bryobacteraceae bacterium]|nr:patatin-like phospholipase family protein [Bryobacteraceae bacterium]
MRSLAFPWLVAMCSAYSYAQQPPRPKIGLVLEGGGALGLAHIGVLEWLEANRIPIDMITGTSMGSLIGGFYASGMSTREIRAVVGAIDWDRMLSGQIRFQNLSYRRKEDRIAFPNRLDFGLRHGLQFPGGLNSGYEIGLLLSRNTLAYADLKSFDDLPIAFRAVATDLISGKEVVFDRGSLDEAMRASMSLPAIFTPPVTNGKAYVDGGVLNNLPIDVAKRMNPDIVIAVHLATRPVDAKELGTLVGVLGRTVSVVVSANELRNMELADVLVVADVRDFDNSDYKKWEALANRGQEAAEKKRAILTRFSLGKEDYERVTQARDQRKKTAPHKAAQLEVVGTSAPLQRAVAKALAPAMRDEALTPARIESALTRVIGQGRFDNLIYHVHHKDGKPLLAVHVQEKAYGPPFFNMAVEIDGKDQANVGFLFSGRVTALDVGGFRSEWRSDFTVGSRYGIASEYYHPLTAASPVFIAPRAYARNSKFEAYDKGDRIAEYRIKEYGAGLDLGITFSRFAELRAGYEAGHLQASRRIGDPLFPEPGFRTDNVSTRFSYEGQDDPIFPRRGIRTFTILKHYLQGDINQMEIRVNAANPVSRTASFLYGLSSGTSFRSNSVGLRGFSLGGPTRMGAYGPNELLGSQYLLGTMGYERELATLPPLLGEKLYVIGLAQAARMDGTTFSSGVPLSFTGFLAAKTALGPIFAGGSWGDRGHRRWFFGLGRIF